MATTYFYAEFAEEPPAAAVGRAPYDGLHLPPTSPVFGSIGKHGTEILCIDGLCAAVLEDIADLANASQDLQRAMAGGGAPSGVIVLRRHTSLSDMEPSAQQLAGRGISLHLSPISNLLEAAQNYLHQYWENRRMVRDNLLQFEAA